MVINWWENDSWLSLDGDQVERENRELRDRVERLERLLTDGREHDRREERGEGGG